MPKAVQIYAKGGATLQLQFRMPGDPEMHVVFTGSAVLTEQMEKYGNHVPFVATIKRVDRYYTLS